MPRIRTVKPEFWSHPVMGRADDSVKTMALALLNYADDHGYFYADASLVRAFARPFDDDSTTSQRCIDELSRVGYIRISEHPERGLIGLIASFDEHQRVDKPKDSRIKQFYSETNPRHIPDASKLEGKGKEGKGKEGKGKEVLAAKVEAPTSVVEFDAEPWVRKIQKAHPRFEGGQANEIAILEAIESIAKDRGCSMDDAGQYLLTRTLLYRQSTATWLDKSRITGATRWFREAMYNQDESIWRKTDDAQPSSSSSDSSSPAAKAIEQTRQRKAREEAARKVIEAERMAAKAGCQ